MLDLVPESVWSKDKFYELPPGVGSAPAILPDPYHEFVAAVRGMCRNCDVYSPLVRNKRRGARGATTKLCSLTDHFTRANKVLKRPINRPPSQSASFSL